MNRDAMIQSYFSSWIQQDNRNFSTYFSDKTVYNECYGPEYHGLTQLNRWFADWNRHGKVLSWDIKAIYPHGSIYSVEWYFKCEYDGHIDGFDGVSLIRFDDDDRILSVKEFQSKAEHWYPYG